MWYHSGEQPEARNCQCLGINQHKTARKRISTFQKWAKQCTGNLKEEALALLITFIYLICVQKMHHCRLAKVNARKIKLPTHKMMTQLMCRFFHVRKTETLTVITSAP